ncbi:hypothetical protein N0V88_006375 [Collariella sp. IMI 366227]|nr:hypothetical protein N0V88_006375 [Collariella sp. IMI 366227]
MPPTLVLIRHAQALHNIDTQSHLPANRKIGLIIVSPMRRALQTCLIGLEHLISQGVPVVPDARWQELYAKPCDTGTPPRNWRWSFRA